MDKIQHFTSTLNLIDFDANVLAPEGSTAARAKRVGFLSSELFSLKISDEMKNHLELLAPNLDKLDVETSAMYRICKKFYDNNINVPPEKVGEYNELKTKSHMVWAKARKENDFASFAPFLSSIVEMRKEMLSYRGSSTHPYDQLLDEFEEGLTMADCDKFFAELKKAIVPLLQRVVNSPKKISDSFKNLPVCLHEQRRISDFVARKVGYDLNRGLIMESVHPFCLGTDRDDVRITTRYLENDFLDSLYCVLHESGHAIYEQNKMDSIANTILDYGVSMGIHESQSRFYENVLGRSKEFWEYITDELKTYLPESFKGITAYMFYEAANITKPSLIRVEADEVTYNLHIMLRYEIEKLIFTENIDVNELPKIWNEKTKEYLGLTPQSDSQGILQDVHWSLGYMGYFPSYSIGSALAVQLHHYMMKANINVPELVRRGDFATITEWLNKEIHSHGSIYPPKELIKRVTGESLSPQYYIDYLTQKVNAVYGL